MQPNREIIDGLDLSNLLYGYYLARNRERHSLGGEEKDGGYSSYLLIDRKHVIEYFIATDRRNFHSGISLGIGPRYINMELLVNEESAEKFSWDNTTDALEQNLALLDDYLAGRLT